MGTSSEAKIKQIKLRVPEELFHRIDELSERYHHRSANQIIFEVLTYYLDLWEQAEQAKLKKISEQRYSVANPMALDSSTKGSLELGKDRHGDTFTPEPLKTPLAGGQRAPKQRRASNERSYHRTKGKGSKKN